MPAKCSVPACRGNYDDSNKVAVFGFPSDERLREKWLHAIPRKDFNVTKNSKVCERYFKDGEVLRRSTFYVEKTGELLSAPMKRPKLKENAVPSIFPDCPAHKPSTSSLQNSKSEKRQKIKSNFESEFQTIAETSFVIKQEPDESIDEPPLPIIEKVLCAEELLSQFSIGGPSSTSSILPVPENTSPIDYPDSTNVDEMPATRILKKSAQKGKINDAEHDAYDEDPDATRIKLLRGAKQSMPSNRKSEYKLHTLFGTSKKWAEVAPKVNDGKPDVNDVAPEAIQDKLVWRDKPSMSSKKKRKHKLHAPSGTSKKSTEPVQKRKINDGEPDANDAVPDAIQDKLFWLAKSSMSSKRKKRRKRHRSSGTSKKSARLAQKRKMLYAEPDIRDAAIHAKFFRRAKLSISPKRKRKCKLHPPAEISKKYAGRTTLPTMNGEKATKDILQFLVDGSESNPLFRSGTTESPGDLFDMFANFIADKLRLMDWDVCAYSLRTILDIVSKASTVQRDSEIESDIDSSNTSSGSSDQE